MSRRAEITRITKETQIALVLNVDGTGQHKINTGIGFLDHMLAQLAFYGLMDLDLSCKGDLEIDSHHTVEDVGLALGAALSQALGERKGIVRFAHAYYPMDESLLRAVVDFSGRPEFHWQGSFASPQLGQLDTQMIPHFFKSLAVAGQMTLHMTVLYGDNDHHKAEGLFKALGRAFSQAVAQDPRRQGVTSTKGVL